MSQVIIEDGGWKAIMADPALSSARSKLSFHEIRLIVKHARASVGRNPEGQDRETGLGRNDEHAVGAIGAETPNLGSTPETGLVEALTKCRDKFLHYEQLHRLKCTSDGDEKADRNRDMADMCDRALSNVLPGEV